MERLADNLKLCREPTRKKKDDYEGQKERVISIQVGGEKKMTQGTG